MTTREQLHERIDALPEELLPRAAEKLDEVPGAPQALDEGRARELRDAVDIFQTAFDPAAHPEWATEEAILEWCRNVRADWDSHGRSLWDQASSNSPDSA
jgi:hypothetical protein